MYDLVKKLNEEAEWSSSSGSDAGYNMKKDKGKMAKRPLAYLKRLPQAQMDRNNSARLFRMAK